MDKEVFKKEINKETIQRIMKWNVAGQYVKGDSYVQVTCMWKIKHSFLWYGDISTIIINV